MIKRELSELKTYEAKGHHGVSTMRVHGKDETKAEEFWVGLSTFLPGGGADFNPDGNPSEKLYYVLEGEMTIIDKDGKKYVLHKDDSISFEPNEGRGMLNESNLPTRILVVCNYVK